MHSGHRAAAMHSPRHRCCHHALLLLLLLPDLTAQQHHGDDDEIHRRYGDQMRVQTRNVSCNKIT